MICSNDFGPENGSTPASNFISLVLYDLLSFNIKATMKNPLI